MLLKLFPAIGGGVDLCIFYELPGFLHKCKKWVLFLCFVLLLCMLMLSGLLGFFLHSKRSHKLNR